MKNKVNLKWKIMLIGFLCIILLLMAVIYATINNLLIIHGTSNISSNWDIEMVSITPSIKATNIGTPSNPQYISSGDIACGITGSNLSANFKTFLVNPGDTVTYTIMIKNKGTLDAKLDTINKTISNNKNIAFDVIGLSEEDILKSGQTKLFAVIVKYKNNDGNTSTENSVSLMLNYIQYLN